MKASKFTEAQIVFVLKQAQDGTPTAEVCRKAGISDVTFYNWRKKYAGLMLSEMRRLRQLEDENTKLKQIVSDLSLDKAMLQDVLSKKAPRPTRKCELVDRLRSEWKVSIRQVYSTLRIDLALYVYKSKRGTHAELMERDGLYASLWNRQRQAEKAREELARTLEEATRTGALKPGDLQV